MVNVACDVVIRRRIWRRDPSSKTLSQLVPCEKIRNIGGSRKVDHKHWTSVTLSSMVCARFRICAAAITASSWVNLSNRLNASSMSFRPASFLRNFSEHRLAYINNLPGSYTLARLCFISFVAIAKMFRTSTIILTMISVIAFVGGTSVYDSRRLKKFSIRSNRSARASSLALTSLAA